MRRRLGLTQDDFAVRAGLGPRTMSNLETGKRAAGFEVIRRICDTYGVCVEWLTTGEGDMFARGVQHNGHGGNIQGERVTVTRHAGESEARHLRPKGGVGTQKRRADRPSARLARKTGVACRAPLPLRPFRPLPAPEAVEDQTRECLTVCLAPGVARRPEQGRRLLRHAHREQYRGFGPLLAPAPGAVPAPTFFFRLHILIIFYNFAGPCEKL